MEMIPLSSGKDINDAEWTIMELALPDRKWRYEEPGAKVTAIEDGGIEMRVDKFTLKGLPSINPTDTGKHFYMSKRQFELPASGKAIFSVEMAAQAINADGENYQYGFVNTILQDVEHSTVFDSATTGKRLYTVYEKILIPGLVKPEDAFTYFTEAPFVVISQNLEWHMHSIEFDIDKKSVVWKVDGKRVNVQNGIAEMPKALNIGIGLFTLKPYVNGESISLIGQGMLGRWKNLSIETDN